MRFFIHILNTFRPNVDHRYVEELIQQTIQHAVVLLHGLFINIDYTGILYVYIRCTNIYNNLPKLQ